MKYKVHFCSKDLKYIAQKPIEDDKYDNSAKAAAFAATDLLGPNCGDDSPYQVFHVFGFDGKIRDIFSTGRCFLRVHTVTGRASGFKIVSFQKVLKP